MRIERPWGGGQTRVWRKEVEEDDEGDRIMGTIEMRS